MIFTMINFIYTATLNTEITKCSDIQANQEHYRINTERSKQTQSICVIKSKRNKRDKTGKITEKWINEEKSDANKEVNKRMRPMKDDKTTTSHHRN